MDGPQKENGYTPVAHKIFEQIGQYGLNGTQRGIIDQVWRYTYGFKRKKAELSLTFLANALKKPKSQVDRELKALIERNIIHASFDDPRKGRYLSFNKYFDTWVTERRPRISVPVRQNEYEESAKTSTKPSAKTRTKKDNKDNFKDNTLSRNKKITYSEDDRYYQMAVYFHGKVMDHAAINKVDHLVRDANLQKWADEFRKIVELDKRDKQELKTIIDWCTQDSFWSTNILSPKKLREKYAELGIKMHKAPDTGGSRAARNKQLLQQKMKEAWGVDKRGDDQTPGDLFGSLPDGGADE